MVFMGNRRPEHRENAIPGGLWNVAVVAADGVDHQFQCRINDPLCLFRIEVFHQFRRTPDVGKQRRHRLALTVDIFVG
jgi:hypothetical protein